MGASSSAEWSLSASSFSSGSIWNPLHSLTITGGPLFFILLPVSEDYSSSWATKRALPGNALLARRRLSAATVSPVPGLDISDASFPFLPLLHHRRRRRHSGSVSPFFAGWLAWLTVATASYSSAVTMAASRSQPEHSHLKQDKGIFFRGDACHSAQGSSVSAELGGEPMSKLTLFAAAFVSRHAKRFSLSMPENFQRRSAAAC